MPEYCVAINNGSAQVTGLSIRRQPRLLCASITSDPGTGIDRKYYLSKNNERPKSRKQTYNTCKCKRVNFPCCGIGSGLR